MMFRYNDDVALFNEPASEIETLEEAVLEECYLANDLTALERKLTASPGFTAVKDEVATTMFAIVGKDFNFFNMDITSPAEIEQQATKDTYKPISPKEVKPRTLDFQEAQFLKSSRLPDSTVKSVQPANNDEYEYNPDDTDNRENKYFYETVRSITTVGVNDIQPKLINKTAGFDGTTNGYTQHPLQADNLHAFTIDGVPVDDGFWGITLANRSFYRQNFETLYDHRNDPALYQDYVHQMSEATLEYARCNKIFLSDRPSKCLLSKLASPIMNPLYTEELKFNEMTILAGFTTYRVVPFFGLDLSGSGDSMLMPQDDFVIKYGGIGFGAASTVTKVSGVDDAIFSFGGFSYAPDNMRPFEKLPHGDRFPKRRSWYPVWPRDSIVHGCAESNQVCTYQEEFDLNTNPRKRNFPTPKISIFNPLTAKACCSDTFYALVRYIVPHYPTPTYSHLPLSSIRFRKTLMHL